MSSARRRERLDRLDAEVRDRFAARGLGLRSRLGVPLILAFGLYFRLNRHLAVAVLDGLAFDLAALADVIREVVVADDRVVAVCEALVLLGFPDVGEQIIATRRSLQAATHFDVLSALQFDRGLCRRF